MTTIITFINPSSKTVFLASDMQVSHYNLKVPLFFKKIEILGKHLMVASCGAVSEFQNLIKMARKSILQQKIEADDTDLEICLEEFVNEMQEYLFSYSHRHIFREIETSFLVCGKNRQDQLEAFSLSPDGSLLKIQCLMIEKFLKEVLASDEDILVIEEIGGDALLGEYRFEKCFMFNGLGRNGKGKTVGLYKRVFGVDNCSAISLKALDLEGFEVSELFGKMLNIAGDISSQDLRDTSTIKALTGRDLIAAKRKFLTSIHFQNRAKLIFCCNELPMIYDFSDGIWMRWLLLDFPYTFVTLEEKNKLEENWTEDQKKESKYKIKDETILEKISTPEELSGLLNKFLDGLDRLIKNKRFSQTKGSQEIRESWISRSNSFMAFAMEHIEIDSSPGAYISKSDLRHEYSKFCKSKKLKIKSDKVIFIVLSEEFGCSPDDTIYINEYTEESLYPNKVQIRIWKGIKWKQKS